jgi:hypothetical protein
MATATAHTTTARRVPVDWTRKNARVRSSNQADQW